MSRIRNYESDADQEGDADVIAQQYAYDQALEEERISQVRYSQYDLREQQRLQAREQYQAQQGQQYAEKFLEDRFPEQNAPNVEERERNEN